MKRTFRDIDEALAFKERMDAKGFFTSKTLGIEKLKPVVEIWFYEENDLIRVTKVKGS